MQRRRRNSVALVAAGADDDQAALHRAGRCIIYGVEFRRNFRRDDWRRSDLGCILLSRLTDKQATHGDCESRYAGELEPPPGDATDVFLVHAAPPRNYPGTLRRHG